MTAALRALIAAVEAGTATGGPDANVVPADMCRLIRAAMGKNTLHADSFVGAHDGDLNAAVAVVKHLHGADCEFVMGYNAGKFCGGIFGKDGPDGDVMAEAPTLARALLLAALRAKLEQDAPSGQKGDDND